MHFEQSNGWARFQQAAGRNVYVVSPSRVVPYSAALERRDDEGIAVEKRIAGPLKFLEINGWGLPQDGTVSGRVQVLRDSGKRMDVVFVRWTPTREFPISNFQFSNLRCSYVVEPRILTRQVPPRATLIIDLTKSEDELLSGMHEKTRYNIHLAERKGVVARSVGAKEAFASFWQLMQDTARRDNIGIHPEEYYRKMLGIMEPPLGPLLSKEGMGRLPYAGAHLYLAVHGGVPIATAILITYEDTATFLHGGSSNANRHVMAPHLLQWRMMQFAKAQGMKWYDMWGISPQDTRYKIQDTKPDSWAGITRFKMGFGGEAKEGAGTYDVVVNQPLYKLLTLAQKAKSIFTM